MRSILSVAVVMVAAALPVRAQWPWQALQWLKPTGQIDTAAVPECSGLVQSLRYPGVFWALSDSGDGASAVIVPVQADGKPARGWSGPVLIEGVRNNDWEDIALDDKGHLIIADTGNNSGRRKQLMLHFVKEPKPGAASAKPFRTLRVHYADQREASPDYDCEAVFSVRGKIYFLTKRRSDSQTGLYRLDGDSPAKSNPMLLVEKFDTGGMVTAADVSPDGKLVAVLTYTALWVFEFDPASGSIFRKGIRWQPVFAWQAEAVAFDGNDEVVIGNEGGQLFRVPLAGMETIRP